MKRFWILLLVLAGAASSIRADDKAVPLDKKEKAFAALLQDAALVGNFTVNRDRPAKENAKQSPERYGIKSIQKVGDGQWLVNSQIKYGQLDVTVPVPVQVHFANDTPVLSVTDLSIPLVGDEFTARVMFFDNQYAGTWRHGKVTGLMYGRVERAAADKPEQGKAESSAVSAPSGSPSDKPAKSPATGGASTPSTQSNPKEP